MKKSQRLLIFHCNIDEISETDLIKRLEARYLQTGMPGKTKIFRCRKSSHDSVFTLHRLLKNNLPEADSVCIKSRVKATQLAKKINYAFTKEQNETVIMICSWKETKIMQICEKIGTTISIKQLKEMIYNSFYLVDIQFKNKEPKVTSL